MKFENNVKVNELGVQINHFKHIPYKVGKHYFYDNENKELPQTTSDMENNILIVSIELFKVCIILKKMNFLIAACQFALILLVQIMGGIYIRF